MARYRKSLIALAGALTQLVPVLALHGTAAHVAQIVLAVATWVSVHFASNAA